MLQKNAVVEDHDLKHEKLVFEFAVVGNATPASKTLSSDLPGVCVLAAEGLTADMVAAEALIASETNYAAPDDSDGKIDVLLKASELGSILKVMKIIAHVKDSAGTFTAAPCTGFGTSGKTTAGNIAFQVDTAVDFSAANGTVVVEVDYVLSK